MIEYRSPYHTESDTPETDPTQKSTMSTADLLVQYFIDGTVSRDSILLLPILQSGIDNDEIPEVCMQLVHLPDGLLGFCNTQTQEYCTCCGASICEKHHAHGFLTILDSQGTECNLPNTLLCETCFRMGGRARTALYTFLRLINRSEGQVHA